MANPQRTRFTITGQVQGVGFRPFVFRTAKAHDLTGTVRNSAEGVVIEVQGSSGALASFAHDLTDKLPVLARIVTLDQASAEPVEEETGFEILHSTSGEGHSVLISPDVATCPDCIADMRDEKNRRHRYPFTNCTNCGPRYTITRSIPYDRPATSMACFPMCPECQAEYDDPMDRRFHAQPNACPVCGPQVWLTSRDGTELARGPEALEMLARQLERGALAAIKGLGGFHLACHATNEDAVQDLRARKNRPDKPLAVMVPDLDTARDQAVITAREAEWLTGIHRPIVLCAREFRTDIAPSVAPDTDYIGLMLPYTPLHHVLLGLLCDDPQVDAPALVMTSGNISGDPICLGNREAAKRLAPLCDLFLFHDRDILIRTDDSVLRVDPVTGKPLFLRRARGFTPSPVFLEGDGPTVLGMGPELKCTLTVTKGDQAFPSQHIGDMENLATLGFHREIATHLTDILQVRPELVVRDLHPNYMTSRAAEEYAAEYGTEVASLQHHFAHVHACLAENKHEGPALGIALDGTGYGEDGTIWGGEILYVDPATLAHRRLAHLAPFPLPGGEMAVREPWRIAYGLLHGLGENGARKRWPWMPEFEAAARLLPKMLENSINCPLTSSCGRLFDAVSALLGLRTAVHYEGQAAIVLEKEQDLLEQEGYALELLAEKEGRPRKLNTHGMIRALLDDLDSDPPTGTMARKFHLGIVNGFADAALLLAKQAGVKHVALSGGVMQNLTLAMELPRALMDRGLHPLVHTQVSPNDGCISLGQAAWGRKHLLLNKD